MFLVFVIVSIFDPAHVYVSFGIKDFFGLGFVAFDTTNAFDNDKKTTAR